MIEWLFWLGIGLIVYSYFIYPLILVVASGVKQMMLDTRYLWQRFQRRAQVNHELPNVSIIIAAYNEEDCIAERIENLLALDYPKEKLMIHIGSDGSSDNTANILRKYQDVEQLTLHIFEHNRGKMSVLNDLIAQSEHELLVLSDANTNFQLDAIKKLVRHFQNDSVGAVCGELALLDAETGDNKDGVYWRYEQVLKFHESRMGALLGANGAIYAMRKSLFKPLPANTIVDDYQIVMNIAKQGYRLVYDPEAAASETVAPDLKAEEGRRIRIGLGNYQALFTMPWALNPFLGWRFIAYFSHKVCRWFVPHFMLVVFASNVFLLEQPIYMALFIGQLCFYLFAVYGIYQQKRQRRVSSVVALVAFFVSMNVALFRGFIRYFSTNVQGSWQRTTR